MFSIWAVSVIHEIKSMSVGDIKVVGVACRKI